MKSIKAFVVVVLLSLLTACGGGGDDSGVVVTGTGSTGATGGTGGTGDTVALFTSAGPVIFMKAGETRSDIEFGGGQPGYVVTVDDANVISATLSGNKITVNAKSVGVSNIFLTDKNASRTAFQVRVSGVGSGEGTPLTTSAPDDLTFAAPGTDNKLKFNIIGGLAPYYVSSSNYSIVNINDRVDTLDNFEIVPVKAGLATIVITDALGAKVRIVAEVGPSLGSVLSTNAPSTLIVPLGEIKYTVSGGGGSYTAVSNNINVLKAEIDSDDSLIKDNLILDARASGSAVVTIKDKDGSAIQFVVTVSNTSQAFFTTAPQALTVQALKNLEFSIGGGSGEYVVKSNDSIVVEANIKPTDNKIFIIETKSSGDADVIITDVGLETPLTITIRVSVRAARLATDLPSALALTVGGQKIDPLTATGEKFVVSGGLPLVGYQVSNDNPGAVKVVPGISDLSQPKQEYEIAPLAPGVANLRFTDGDGTFVESRVTVTRVVEPLVSSGPDLVYMIHETSSTSSDNVRVFEFQGGAPQSDTVAYRVQSDREDLVKATFGTLTTTKNQLTLTATDNKAATGDVKITVTDFSVVPQKFEFTVRLGSLARFPLDTDAPDIVNLLVGEESETFTAFAGTGSYRSIISSNPEIVALDSTVLIPSFKMIANRPGSSTVTVIDSEGAKKVIAVTVTTPNLYTTAPANVTLFPNATTRYRFFVAGGDPLSAAADYYYVSSNNEAVVTVSRVNPPATVAKPVEGVEFEIESTGATGFAQIAISDRQTGGTVLTIQVEASRSASAPLTVNPLSITGRVLDVLILDVTNGVAPYTVLSTNPAEVKPRVNTIGADGGPILGNTLEVDLLRPTPVGAPVKLVFRDKSGQVFEVSITVLSEISDLRFIPQALTISELQNGAFNLLIAGGTAPYRVFTSNAVLAPLSGPVGNVLTVGAVASRCVAADTAVTLTVLDSLDRAATHVLTIDDDGTCP
jgi:hypothetical protein